jgi:hypothetical protein
MTTTPTGHVARRIKIERSIARRCVRDLLKAGYSIKVDSGDEVTAAMTDERAIAGAMMLTDEDWLLVHSLDGAIVGWVRFIYGSDGWDVINDYSTNLETCLTGTHALAERYAETG